MQHNVNYEEWLDLEEFPNYQVSSFGRVRNKITGYILKPFTDRYGYLRLSIGTQDNVYVHKLVCETFYGHPDDPRAQVNHIDCNRQNNHVFNLEYCSPSENIRWACRHGNLNPLNNLKKAIENNRRPVRIIELDKVFESVKDCADFLGVRSTNISRCLIGERKGQMIHGYHVEYLEGEA